MIMVRERLPTLATVQEMSAAKATAEAPGKDEIAVFTAGLEPVHQEKDKANPGAPPLDFQSELPRLGGERGSNGRPTRGLRVCMYGFCVRGVGRSLIS